MPSPYLVRISPILSSISSSWTMPPSSKLHSWVFFPSNTLIRGISRDVKLYTGLIDGERLGVLLGAPVYVGEYDTVGDGVGALLG